MKRIAYATEEGIIIAAFGGAGSPSPDEWRGYLAFLESVLGHRQRALILAAGGRGLEPHQRRDLEAIGGPAQKRDRRLAVITTSTFARGFAKALALFDAGYRCFYPRELDLALTYLEVLPGSRADVKRVAAELETQVIASP